MFYHFVIPEYGYLNCVSVGGGYCALIFEAALVFVPLDFGDGVGRWNGQVLRLGL